MKSESVIAAAYRRYFSIRGRASRAEYFVFLWYVVGVTAMLMLIESQFMSDYALSRFTPSAVFFCLHVIPMTTVFVRRLHDVDEDIPLLMVPVWVGILVAVGLMAQFGYATLFGLFFIPLGQLMCLQMLREPGTTGANRFGDDPMVEGRGTWHGTPVALRATTREVYRVKRG